METISLFSGLVRSVIEKSFEDFETPKLSFVEYLVAANATIKPDKQLLTRLLAPYSTASRPILILLEKSVETLLNICDSSQISGQETLRQSVAKLFTTMMRRNQETEGTDLVNLCLEPLRKVEFLSRHKLCFNKFSPKWNIAELKTLKNCIDKRLLNKKIAKSNKQLIDFILDSSISHKEIEVFLNRRETYLNLLFRSSRLPSHFRLLSTKSKVAFLHGWLSSVPPSTKKLHNLPFFAEFTNGIMREIEIMADILCFEMQSINYAPWHDLKIETKSLIELLTAGIGKNLAIFAADSLPYYVVNTLQKVALAATKYAYFDPVYYYVQSSPVMAKQYGSEEETATFSLGQRVVKKKLLR